MGLRSGPSGIPYGGIFKHRDWQHYVGKIGRSWIDDPVKIAWMDEREPRAVGRFNRHTLLSLAMTAFDDAAGARANATVRGDSISDRFVGKLHAETSKALLALPLAEWHTMCGRMLDDYDSIVYVGRPPWFVRAGGHMGQNSWDVWPEWARQLLATIEAEHTSP